MVNFFGNLSVLLGGIFGIGIGFVILALVFAGGVAAFIMMYSHSQAPRLPDRSLTDRRAHLG